LTTFSDFPANIFQFSWASGNLAHSSSKEYAFCIPQSSMDVNESLAVCLRQFAIIQFHLTQSFSNNFPNKYSNKYKCYCISSSISPGQFGAYSPIPFGEQKVPRIFMTETLTNGIGQWRLGNGLLQTRLIVNSVV
jgi:hypothetical protein